MMQWRPTGDQRARIARANMLRSIRIFFDQKSVLEVDTPALSLAANSDPYIDSFEVKIGQQSRYLHTSPEYPMKRLLAAGSGDIYQICKVWRNEPSSKHHNAEFTMLEYYRVGFDLSQLMQEVDTLLRRLLPQLKNHSQYHTYQALFLDKLGVNPHTIPNDDLQDLVTSRVPELIGDLERQAALDLLLTHCIEPTLPIDCLSFISDYPASQSALAQIEINPHDAGSKVAKRFEVYLGDLELGNGYQELTDPVANRDVLESDLARRCELNVTQPPLDQHFLDALVSGLPNCSGVAIGVDRLVMLATEEKQLNKVLNFAWENA